MLVLSRRKNQSVMIGHDLQVVVLEIREGQVRLGFRAPIEVPIHRQEIYDRIQKETGNIEM